MFLIGLTLNPATIAAGQPLSGPVALGALTLVGISMPAAWTAASLTFQVSPDGGATWQELFDGAGIEVKGVGAAGQVLMRPALPSYVWRGLNMLQLRSGTAGAPVNQVAQAIVKLISREEMI